MMLTLAAQAFEQDKDRRIWTEIANDMVRNLENDIASVLQEKRA